MEQPTESTNTSLYSLYIQIGSLGISVSVFDDSYTLLSQKKISVSIITLSTNELVEIVKKETQLYYRKIKLIYESDIYTLIPDSIFSTENVKDFLYLQHKAEPNEKILYNKIFNWGVVVAFTIPVSIHNALNQVFPYITIEHHLSFVLTDKVKKQNETCIYIWVRSKMMDLIVFKNGKLILVNSFAYQTPEDFTYFTLNVYEQFSLDIDKCNVFLLNADKKPELQKTLDKYLVVSRQ
jgi:hypothetical protein